MLSEGISVLFYIFFFVGIIGFVVAAFAVYNLLTKSYRPQNIFLILVPILIVLAVFIFLTAINLSSLINGLDLEGDNNQPTNI